MKVLKFNLSIGKTYMSKLTKKDGMGKSNEHQHYIRHKVNKHINNDKKLRLYCGRNQRCPKVQDSRIWT